MKKYFLLLFTSLLSSVFLLAQQAVSGSVVDENQEPLIGVSVMVKGTTIGVITDFDGHYSVSVPENSTLSFTYIGMKPQEFRVTPSTSVINVTMQADALVIDEVVVTAMGIQQEKKRMNFAVQSVNSEALTEGRSANFVNALQGKVAGLSVTTASGSPNAGSQVIVRGISSINPSQSNEPLFVMDGMPLRGGGSEAADINPNDIENITVLKGAAAAALYGQDAASGVIMITTKRGQVGKVTATANASWQFDKPTRVPKLQNMYGPGDQGFYKEKLQGGWGPLLDPNDKIYDNIGNFLQTGFYQKYDISLSGGSEKFQTYASATYSRNEGIVPNDYLNRMGIMIKSTYQPVKSLTLTVSANIQEAVSRSFGDMDSSTRSFENYRMQSVYNWPINDDISNYELTNGYPRFLHYSDINKYSSPVSPLYARYNDYEKDKRVRNIINGSLNWNPVRNLEIIGRISYDTTVRNKDAYTVPRWDDSVIYENISQPNLPDDPTAAQLEQYQRELQAYQEFLYNYRNTPYLTESDIADMDKKLLGSYTAYSSRSQMFTANAIATYKIELPRDFSIDVLAGTELKMSEGFNMENYGVDFIIPGTYSLSNTNSDYLFLTDRTAEHSKKRTFGYFGEIRGDYKGIASLSVTSRWDWSSTILSNPYYYPSVTAGLLFSELFNISNNIFNYGKLRGNYAVVGKDAPQKLYDRRYK